ncbi:MAG: alpha/beta hydrolase [Chloroflexi bacterium]|nr:MAG: alpha/beta hydrolase [Chloroflexota bacterium]
MNPSQADDFYRDVPPTQRQRLLDFRAAHPAKAFRVAGVDWPYLAGGQGKKTILLLAGAFLCADMWFYPIGELEADFRILAPDTNMLSGLSARQALDALPRLLDAEGVEKVAIVGFSAGGGLAQMLLQEHPERVTRVVFSHTGVIETRPGVETQIRRLAWLVRVLPLAVSRRVLLHKTSGNVPASSAWKAFHDAYFRESSAAISKDLLVRFLENGLELRRDYRYQPLTDWPGRMLILSSRDDAVTLPSLEKLRERHPNAQVHLFNEGGHHTFMLYPETYTTVLTNFLITD